MAFATYSLNISASVDAEVLFYENFDQQNDWYPQTKMEGCSEQSCSQSVPVGWNYYRNDELWHPDTDGPGYHPTIQISSENYKGNSGKAFTVWNESNDGRSGDGWGADGILAKDLGKDYKEIYIQLYIKFQKDFQWNWNTTNGAAVKMVRFYHWDRVGSPFHFFTSGMVSPAYIYDTSYNQYGFRHFHSHRCDPQETNYRCTPTYDKSFTFLGNPSFEQLLGDGAWHQMRWYAKMNSTPGANDGAIEFWLNGTLQYSRYDVQWMGSSSPSNFGWNIVAIGGNAFNTYSDAVEKKEQWYAIDDVIISSTPLITTPEIKSIITE